MVDEMGLRAELLQNVVLIRHAEPQVERDRPPAEWRLSSRGSELSYVLGACLISRGLRQLVTSPEEKALATATAVAHVLGVSVIADDRLREVQRPWTDSNFPDAVARYLQGDLIEGWEPFEEVVSRLEASLLSHSGEGPIGFVTHGTAMACLLDSADPKDRAIFWSDLTMPDAWALFGENISRLCSIAD